MEHRIRFLPSGRERSCEDGASLLETAREAGLPVASACGADRLCGRCGLEIVEGGDGLAAESERERQLKERNRIDPRLRLACFVLVNHDLVVTAPYWGTTEKAP